MPEPKSSFAAKFLERGAADAKAFSSERQLTAQAFDLHVETRDGLESEGLPWSHYSGRWHTKKGELEKLVIFFGERMVEIEGHNLEAIVEQIREGRLTGVREMLSSQAQLTQAEGNNEPIVSAVKMYPTAEEIVTEIKGDGHESGFTRKVRGR